MSNKNGSKGAKNTTASNSFEDDINEGIETVFHGLVGLILYFFRGLGQLIKILVRKPISSILVASLFLGVSYWFISKGYHIYLLYYADPETFTPGKLDWLYDYSLKVHLGLFNLTVLFITSTILGHHMESIREKYKDIFQNASLTNGHGDTPKLVSIRKLDKYRTEYLFDSNGVGLSEFEDKKERIEARFDCGIDTIKQGKRRKFVTIIFNKREIPEYITYKEIEALHHLEPETFYIGMSTRGLLTQHVAMPHMLISGATGSGKSVCFKGILASLIASPVLESKVKKGKFQSFLESIKFSKTKRKKQKKSPPVEVIGIDLKGGLEFTDFKEAPNFKIVKTLQGAVTLLQDVEREMMKRFKYLEEKGFKTIEPSRDNMNRIVIACDEASVLFMERPRTDPEYNLVIQARKILDTICKLSRAGSINCIFATQKLDRSILPTSVSENIEARLAFKANSEQGSMRVLGSTAAYKLPKLGGRALWKYGNELVEVQVPFIDGKEIKKRCLDAKLEFEKGKKELVATSLGITEKTAHVESKNEFEQGIIEED